MGCDIHAFVEVKKDGKWVFTGFQPFDWRGYGLFGFLANVRNYSFVPTLSEPRDLPPDISTEVAKAAEDWYGDDHSHSWFSQKELRDFDYSKTFEDRRTTKQTSPNSWNGAADAGEGNGKITTFKDFLGEGYFTDVAKMSEFGAAPENTRVVFWFDN